MAVDTRAARLRPVPASVPAARAMVREALAGYDHDLRDAAELCMSELVTNGVLHAGTTLEARIELLGERVRLEIRDHSPTRPRSVLHSTSAATGRGLDLVRALSTEWGVTLLHDDGKVVWCEVAPEPVAAELDEEALLAAWLDEADEPAAEPTDEPAAEPHLVLLGYPVRLGWRQREHVDALTRECMLIHQAAQADAGTSAPARLVELAAALTERYSAELAAPERRKLEALRRGDATVDLFYPHRPEAPEVLRAWQSAFAALDAYAEAEQLLTLQTPPDVARLRDWVLDQLLAQTDGAPPTPWTGPLE